MVVVGYCYNPDGPGHMPPGTRNVAGNGENSRVSGQVGAQGFQPVTDGLGSVWGSLLTTSLSSPSSSTWGRLFLSLFGHYYWAASVFIGASLLDLVDGSLARRTGKSTPFGSFLDSTLDRMSEGVIFAAIAYRLAIDQDVALQMRVTWLWWCWRFWAASP